MKSITLGGCVSASLFLGTLLLTTGCSTLIKQSYEGDPAASNTKLAAYSGSTAVYGSTDPEGDGRQLVSEGYARIGMSNFQKDGRVKYEELQSEAKDVGADVVLFSVKWQGSRQCLPPVALNNDGAPYTLAPFVYPNSVPAAVGSYSSANSGDAAISGQSYSYMLSFWRKAPTS
jgi:hypothetical protein